MTGFEPRTSGVGSDSSSTNYAIITAPLPLIYDKNSIESLKEVALRYIRFG